VYAIDTDCVTSVAASALASWAVCRVWAGGDPEACRDRALSRYRIGSIDCRSIERVELADTELDATELVADAELLPLPEPEQPAPPEDDPALAGQVVELPEGDSEPPEDAELLAERNMKVDKQMVRHGDPSEPLAGPAAAPEAALVAAAPPEPELPQALPSAAPPARSSGVLSMRAPGAPGEAVDQRTGAALDLVPSTSGLGLALGALAAAQARSGEAGGVFGETAGPAADAPGAPPRGQSLFAQAAAAAEGTGGSNDYLPGVDEGELTALNARRWKYASFFNRVKRDVAQNWDPERAYRLRDPTGNVYGSKDRLTVLQVSLKPDGTLHKVVVAGPSGVDFLDDEAVKAFELAQPFANPPRGLIDSSSQLITFQFGFAFEIERAPTWRVFRY
jgi:TonB family protein